jgi:hypothetical protein
VRTDNYGHLSKALFVESSPIISPTIFVVSAWYGMTTAGMYVYIYMYVYICLYSYIYVYRYSSNLHIYDKYNTHI